MYLTKVQTLILIFTIASGTMLTRFLPFLLFPEQKNPPKWVDYFGKVLPAAVIGLLVVYCLKTVNIFKAPFGLPEGISIACIVLIHSLKRNTLLSIASGTICYMVLYHFLN